MLLNQSITDLVLFHRGRLAADLMLLIVLSRMALLILPMSVFVGFKSLQVRLWLNQTEIYTYVVFIM